MSISELASSPKLYINYLLKINEGKKEYSSAPLSTDLSTDKSTDLLSWGQGVQTHYKENSRNKQFNCCSE